MMAERLIVMDVTLDQVERTPGCGLNLEERLRLAHQLERLRSDVIEAGSPMASPGDFEAVRLIARTLERGTVAARCRALPTEIDRAFEALQSARNPRLNISAGMVDISGKGRGKTTIDEVVGAIGEAVTHAVSLCRDVQFTWDDAVTTDEEVLHQIIERVVHAGACTVCLSDGDGYAMPDEYGAVIASVSRLLLPAAGVVLSASCANDLGLATANTLAALHNGARQVECTVNGIGARAGRTALEEIVMILRSRKHQVPWTVDVNAEEISRTSRLLSSLSGMPIQRNKPVVGANIFAQPLTSDPNGEGGSRRKFERMTPQSIGLKYSTILLDKHADLNALGVRYRELGYDLRPAELDRVYRLFRQLVEQKKEILDGDLIAILDDESPDSAESYHLEDLQVHSGTKLRPTATIELRRGTERFVDSATGDGPVDAAYKAIERITGQTGKLTEYLIKSVSIGRDGFGEVFVRLEFEGLSFHGRGISTDVITGSAKAYVEALNRWVVARRKRAQPKTEETGGVHP
jgi:2-isopropylmalate synthase